MSENAVTGWDVLDSAHRALRSAALGMAPGDGERPTPCKQWTVTQVLQHAAENNQLAWAAAITGEPSAADNPFTPSGQLAGTPLAVVDEALRTAAAAWATVGVYAGDVPSPLPQGPLPASLAAGACALDAAIHAWDIAVATGQPSPLTPALARLHCTPRPPRSSSRSGDSPTRPRSARSPATMTSRPCCVTSAGGRTGPADGPPARQAMTSRRGSAERRGGEQPDPGKQDRVQATVLPAARWVNCSHGSGV